jgi:hypothetical protein
LEENGNDAQKVMFMSLVFPSFRMCCRKCVGYRAGSVSYMTCYYVISCELVVPFISCDLNLHIGYNPFLMQSNVQVALERENDNLKRECSMMTMAWYDLSSRVQSNTVMLQRRSEVSKSWINKQRRAVNPTGRR